MTVDFSVHNIKDGLIICGTLCSILYTGNVVFVIIVPIWYDVFSENSYFYIYFFSRRQCRLIVVRVLWARSSVENWESQAMLLCCSPWLSFLWSSSSHPLLQVNNSCNKMTSEFFTNGLYYSFWKFAILCTCVASNLPRVTAMVGLWACFGLSSGVCSLIAFHRCSRYSYCNYTLLAILNVIWNLVHLFYFGIAC